MPLRILPPDPPEGAAPEEPHAAIELAGSVLARLDRRGTSLLAILSPARVHRSHGRPGVDPGTIWHQDVRLTLAAGAAHGDLEGLPCTIAGATLSLGGVPMPPWIAEAPGVLLGIVEIEVVDPDGRRALLLGAGLESAFLGMAQRLEPSAGES
jgi:hypothetical protein